MIRVEFTISRRHLFVLVGILAVGVLAVPGVSWAAGRFDDVPDSNVFVSDIEWLADAGITKGCNPPANTEFCPGSYVTREQMAAFMHRLSGGDSRTVDGRLDALETLLAGVSREGDTLLLSGMNLQVVNGMGTTASKNILGNVIIGYNEPPGGGTVYRGGSHYLVVGPGHQYRSWGGIVAGYGNTASGEWASVTGGHANTASGPYSSVTGGTGNTASNSNASVSGGLDNTASGPDASVSGGRDNTASGGYASVTGGYNGIANGTWASVTGGFHSTASGDYSSVTGGWFNTVSGDYDTVVGGDDQTCSGPGAIACGEGSFGLAD
ncbi:MAG: S-layer homology domain-containing protein [Actinomycetota bacterium]|nr:S-layer homology domain-containing protein [Actinomycetota bacterium]